MHFEVKGHLEYQNGRAISEDNGLNPFIAIKNVLENMLKEIQHKIRKK